MDEKSFHSSKAILHCIDTLLAFVESQKPFRENMKLFIRKVLMCLSLFTFDYTTGIVVNLLICHTFLISTVYILIELSNQIQNLRLFKMLSHIRLLHCSHCYDPVSSKRLPVDFDNGAPGLRNKNKNNFACKINKTYLI